MTDHLDALAKATATMMDMIAKGQQMQAAVIRNAPAQEVEQMRQDFLAMAEAYTDRQIEAAAAVRALLSSPL